MESAILSSVARALSPRTRVERARRKGYRRRRTAIKKLHELESICGYEIWTLMKKDNKIYIHHSANRSPEPSLRIDILETYPLPVIYTSGNADGDEPGIKARSVKRKGALIVVKAVELKPMRADRII